MKKIISALIVSLALAVAPAGILAADAPVLLTHELSSALEQATSLTLYLNLRLQNQKAEPLTDLELSFVPLPPFQARSIVLKLPALGPHEAAELTLALTTAPLQNAAALAQGALYFNGKGTDQQGRTLEFSVISQPGLRGGVR
jgi:hypothetical protein